MSIKFVEDADTSERIGWYVDRTQLLQDAGVSTKNPIEWTCRGIGGFVADPAAALAAIEKEELAGRERDAEQHREWQAILDLPEPIRSARLRLERARVNVEIERCRNIRRADDLARAETALREAELAHAAAMRAREAA